MATLVTSSTDVRLAEQIRNEGGFINAIAGRAVSNWPQFTMIAGLVISIVGVAASVFTSNFMAAAGFGAAALISLAGLFIADSAIRAEQWKENVERLQKEKFFFNERTNVMVSLQKDIKSNSDRLRAAQDLLGSRIITMENDAGKIGSAYQSLDKALRVFKDTNTLFLKNREDLIQRVQELKAYVDASSSSLQEYKSVNTHFTTQVQVLSSIVSNMEKIEEAMKFSLNPFTRKETSIEAPGCSDYVQIAKLIMTDLEKSLTLQREHQRRQIGFFAEHCLHIEEANSYITKFQQDVEAMHAHIGSLNKQMAEIAVNLSSERQLMGSTADLLEANARELFEGREELQNTLKKFQGNQHSIVEQIFLSVKIADQMLSQKQQELEELLQRSKVKEERLNEISTQIEMKRADLESMKYQLKNRKEDLDKKEHQIEIRMIATQKMMDNIAKKKSY